MVLYEFVRLIMTVDDAPTMRSWSITQRLTRFNFRLAVLCGSETPKICKSDATMDWVTHIPETVACTIEPVSVPVMWILVVLVV